MGQSGASALTLAQAWFYRVIQPGRRKRPNHPSSTAPAPTRVASSIQLLAEPERLYSTQFSVYNLMKERMCLQNTFTGSNERS